MSIIDRLIFGPQLYVFKKPEIDRYGYIYFRRVAPFTPGEMPRYRQVYNLTTLIEYLFKDKMEDFLPKKPSSPIGMFLGDGYGTCNTPRF